MATLPAGRVRTPTLLQMEMTECGAASLGILLAYHGRFVPLAELRRTCGVSRDGSKASSIVRAARSYGLVAKGYKKDVGDLKDLAYPYVVFWGFNHFLVVEGARGGRVFLNDPATGPRTASFAEFDESYTGVVLAMEPGPDFQKGGRRPSVTAGLARRLRGSWSALSSCALAAFLLVLPVLATSALMQAFVDNVVVRGLADWGPPLVFGLALLALVHGALAFLQLRLLRRLRLKLSVCMSAGFVWHLLRLPADYYAQRYSGEIASRIVANDTVADVLSGRLATTFIDLFMILFYAAVMLQLDPVLTGVALSLAAANVVALRWAARRRVDGSHRSIQERGKLSAITIAGLQGMRTLKASALESDYFARWAGTYAKVANTEQALAVSNRYAGLVPRFVASALGMLVLVVGGVRVIDGAMTIGMLVAFQSLVVGFLAPLNGLLSLGSTLQELEGDVTRLDDVLDSAAPPVTAADDFPLVKLRGEVALRGVVFGYNPAGPPLIDALSLTVSPGHRVAFVGGSGSGKSTLGRLIAGLYEPGHGEILLDGRRRSELPRSVVTSSLAFVDQDVLLFAGTIRDNVTLWDPAISESDVVRACRDAAIHDDIVALPDGYESRLIEGAANLSGGQRQRLEIARALAIDPSILVLDEATSALDAATERVIDHNIRRRGCTVISIAHRVSTIRDANEILVLEQGRVVERGTHDELAARGGAYRRLIAADAARAAE